MNKYETNMIKDRLNKQQQIIKTEHRKPKRERDNKSLNIALKKSQIYKRWLNEK